MAYINKRSGKIGAKRFTGLYKAVDGTYKSAGTFDTEERALEVAQAAERHARLKLAETSPADRATVTLATYMEMFLSTADIEANSKETYARHLTLHVIPYIGKQRVAEVSRETIHRLLTVVLKEGGASQTTILHTRTALSAMLQMAWDNGYRKDNPVRGIKLKGVPAKPIIVATKDQFLRVYNALPHQSGPVSRNTPRRAWWPARSRCRELHGRSSENPLARSGLSYKGKDHPAPPPRALGKISSPSP